MGVKREHVLLGVKTALGAAAAIFLANVLGLKYSATAGIITVLSIMGTKRETLRIAGGRLAALMSALAIAAASYHTLGFTLAGFAAYLFVFTVVCHACRWTYALAMVSVLMSHFMSEGTMTWALVSNEVLLFVIGVACGVAVNLPLRADRRAMQAHIRTVDDMMRAGLHALSRAPEGLADAEKLLPALSKELTAAERLAASNADNTFGEAPLYDIRYVQMRANQRRVLKQMCAALREVKTLPVQHRSVSDLFARVAREYQQGNDVSALLAALDGVLADMRTQPLPAERDEFESRAVLFYVLLRLRDFLQLKRQFYEENQEGDSHA